MKKLLCIVLAFTLLLTLCSCARSQPEKKELPVSDTIFYGKVVGIISDSLLLTHWPVHEGEKAKGDLYFVSKGQDEEFAAGDIVSVDYNGEILETYPGSFAGVTKVEVVDKSDDIAGLYVSVFRDLFGTDTALNDDIKYLAFDLSKCTNLTGGEKEAVIYLCRNEFDMNVTPIEGTYDELVEDGYIDGENLYFENGVLFSIYDVELSGKTFTFSAEKWRSGLGAIGMSDCKAKLKGSVWDYTKGNSWIS